MATINQETNKNHSMTYISKKDRNLIHGKYDGLCAYSGTPLQDDWQVDHIEPVIRDLYGNGMLHPERHTIDNMIPAQRIINKYKSSLDLETFRTWLLGGLHERLKRLPKNPRTERSVKKKEFLLTVAGLFGIDEDTPFSGTFYFETLNPNQ